MVLAPAIALPYPLHSPPAVARPTRLAAWRWQFVQSPSDRPACPSDILGAASNPRLWPRGCSLKRARPDRRSGRRGLTHREFLSLEIDRGSLPERQRQVALNLD